LQKFYHENIDTFENTQDIAESNIKTIHNIVDIRQKESIDIGNNKKGINIETLYENTKYKKEILIPNYISSQYFNFLKILPPSINTINNLYSFASQSNNLSVEQMEIKKLFIRSYLILRLSLIFPIFIFISVVVRSGSF